MFSRNKCIVFVKRCCGAASIIINAKRFIDEFMRLTIHERKLFQLPGTLQMGFVLQNYDTKFRFALPTLLG